MRERLKQWFGIAAIGGLVGLAATATGLVFAIFPGLKPDPAERQVASARIVAVEPRVPLGEYVERRGREVPTTRIRAPSPESVFPGISVGEAVKQRFVACLPGDVYYIQQNLEGFKGRDTSIRPWTYSLKTGRLSNTYDSVSGGTPFLLGHERTTEQEVIPVWVQYPYRTGRFFVRFGIFHAAAFLGLVDGEPFVISQSDYSKLVTDCFNEGR